MKLKTKLHYFKKIKKAFKLRRENKHLIQYCLLPMNSSKLKRMFAQWREWINRKK